MCGARVLSGAFARPSRVARAAFTAQEQSLERQGKYAEAIPLAKQLLERAKQSFGKDDPAVAHACLILARLDYEVADYSGSEPLLQETLRIYRKMGAESEEVATTLSFMEQTAIKLFQQEQELEREGKYVEAIPLAQQVLELSRRRAGPENGAVAYALEILAALYNRLDKYEQAEPLYLEALGIMKEAKGPESKDVAATLKRLGRLYYDMGEYAKAEPLFQEELRIENKQFGPESKEVAETLGNLGGVYSQIGDYARSEPLLQEELKIEKKTLGLESKEVATTLNNLGVLSLLMGDHATAEPLYLEALRIQKKVLGPENEDVARTLNNLAQVYAGMRDYEKAAYCYGQALQVEKKVLGPEDLYVAITLNNLALLWDDAGNYAEAERLYQDSLRIREKIQGPGHPGVATTLDNLALLYHHMGKYAKAEPLYQEALGIYSKWFGDEHPDTIICRRKLALLDIDLGRSDDARALALTACNNQAHLVEKILSFASEQQRLAYQKSNSVLSLSVLAATKGNEVPLALAILHDKGVVLDSLMEDQAFYRANRKTARGEDLLDKLATDKQRIGRLLLEPIQNSTQSKDELQGLQDEMQTIESKLAKDVTSAGRARRAQSVTAEQIVSALPQDTALIEYFACGNYLGQAQWEGAFGAVVFLRGQKEIFVTLPSSKVLGPTIKSYRHLLSQGNPPDGDEVTYKLAQLYQQVWEPIQKVLPSTIKRVIISPDGPLNFISFATLLDSDQQFLGERLVVEYVTAGRDILEATPAAANKDCLIVANPDFQGPADNDSSNMLRMRGGETRELEDLHFDWLAGTMTEASQLKKQLESWNWKPSLLTANDATKAALFKVHRPYLLHLATHGFFEPIDSEDWKAVDSSQLNEGRARYFDNPMHRSGLALAGANLTLAAWRNKQELTPADDGILTAEDAAALDLEGTWLVTLSACDTGEGEANAGEGVMGLRRGFLEAGAENILMTLWSISDSFTGQFMNDFYQTAHANGNAPLALAIVQRDWLRKLRKERDLVQAVRLAGPFVLCFRGRP